MKDVVLKSKTTMEKKNVKNKMGNIDYSLLWVIIILLSIGAIMVYSASSYYALYTEGSSAHFMKKEMIWVIAGFLGMVFTMSIDYHKYKKITPFLFIITILVLIAVLFGPSINGAKRWIRLGPLSFQPSELAKYVVVLYLAMHIDRSKFRIRRFWSGTIFYLTMAGIFAGLIYLEENLSITAIVCMVAWIMVYVGGAKKSHVLSLVPAGVAVGLIGIFSSSYRIDRFTSFLDPWKDVSGNSYQLIQSFYALGSGGTFGVGLGESRQKALFMPEPHNDFIFSIIGEELGFIGCLFLILLFVFIAFKGIKIAVTARDHYGLLLAVGITSVITIQAIINIAVVTGSMPVTGVPMPFVSYGGTSLVFNMLAMGILLNISRQRKEAN